jgi:hypothetical protein
LNERELGSQWHNEVIPGDTIIYASHLQSVEDLLCYNISLEEITHDSLDNLGQRFKDNNLYYRVSKLTEGRFMWLKNIAIR